MSDAIFERLKQSTQPEHSALEARLSLVIGDLNVDRYKELLAAMYGFYLPWEDSIRPWRERLFGRQAAFREKTIALMEDLAFHEIRSESLPVCRTTPKISDLSAALGSMYVMEGATLGGQLIARSIERQLGLTDGAGYRFFRSYGSKTGAMWREFRERISVSTPTPASENQTLVAASAAFAAMRRWLVETGF